MPRRPSLFSLFSGLSFMLLVAVYALWLPSAGAASPHEISWTMFGDRYTLRSHHGWLALCRPPAATDGSASMTALLAPLSNDDLDWSIQGRPARRIVVRSRAELATDPGFTPTGCSVRVAPMGIELAPPKPDPSQARPLLDALDDVRRFAIAHVLLYQQFGKTAPRPTVRMQDGVIRVSFDGLEAEVTSLPLPPKPEFPTTDALRPKPMVISSTTIDAGRATIDPAQLPRIRQQWHDLLDVTVISAPHAALMGLFLICPMIWAVRLRRRLQWASPKSTTEEIATEPPASEPKSQI